MPYLRIYIGDDDADIMEIWDGLPPNGKSAWVKDAIREKADREKLGASDEEVVTQILTAEDLRAVIREELAGLQIATTKAQDESESEVSEDRDAANKILGMF
ncbi:MAG: hypothetical protein GVY30_00115 [Chloroflexi bacterium]|jgi:hypothetical protein|nr:hypothetical protein [Chloroflexota bacterium]